MKKYIANYTDGNDNSSWDMTIYADSYKEALTTAREELHGNLMGCRLETVHRAKEDKGTYAAGKERAREEAVKWQEEFGKASHSWAEVAAAAAHFSRTGKRFGLLREFKTNGII